jgi:ferredoxin
MEPKNKAVIRCVKGDRVWEVPLSPVVSVLNLLLREGIPIPHSCGGKALCGTCRVRVVSDKGKPAPINGMGPREAERLGSLHLDPPYRLACQIYARSSVTIEIPVDP